MDGVYRGITDGLSNINDTLILNVHCVYSLSKTQGTESHRIYTPKYAIVSANVARLSPAFTSDLPSRTTIFSVPTVLNA